MKRNTSLIAIVLLILAGLLIVGGLVGAAFLGLFGISSFVVSAGAPSPVIVEEGVPPGEAQSPSGEAPAPAEPLPDSEEAAPEGGIGVVAPQGFNAIIDSQLHFALAYPSEWEEGDRVTDFSRVFYVKDPTPSGVGPLPILYVTFMPLEESLAYGAYGFMPQEFISGFKALSVGEAWSAVPDGVGREYATYTRLPDQEVGGLQALVIENERVWEAPEASTDRRVLIETEAGVILLGSTYETPAELALFEQVLDTFQYVP